MVFLRFLMLSSPFSPPLSLDPQVALLCLGALVPARWHRRDARRYDRLPAAALRGEGGELAADAAGGDGGNGWKGLSG